ncbi:MAG: S8 family serine peptidase [Prevotella sp.]|nr:S8 family serine peptidase [Prevotella sp.]
MRRFIFMIILSGMALVGFAQNEAKFTPSTLMFLSEHKGETSLPQVNKKKDFSLIAPLPFGQEEMLKKKDYGTRTIAASEMVGGVEMISAFIGVSDNNFSAIEALGVQIESKFDKLCTALIPVDQIEALAALDNVTRIEVAEILQPANDLQRKATQAGDAISNSAAAQALGLTKQYTGKNVILGIIDTGIDFQHIAFKDKNGKSRIVRAYKLSGSQSTSLTTYSSESEINGLTYDTNGEDHGTHTSSTAGGSSVIVNGSTVTVTDDHANATYGGMAPEADLVIAGLSSLYTTSIGTAIKNICNYADEVGKPCVISLSLGTQEGPHDGTGSIASIVNQYAGNNHIIVYAASNDGMKALPFQEIGTSNGGGMYASGTSTSSKPMIVNVQRSFEDADGNVEMAMPTITAYARSANVPTALKFHVVDISSGKIVYSSNAYTSSTTFSVTGTSDLAQYFKCPSTQYTNQYGDAGKIRLVRTQDTNNNKYYWQIYCPIMVSTSYNDDDEDGVYNSQYAFCVSVYPTSNGASTTIDMWESAYSWFGTDLNLNDNSYNYCKGNDECSVSDNACYEKVISVGAYVTKNQITDYAGTTHDFTDDYPNIGDHASFSSWQTAGYGPLGTALPTINAPGARIVAGINHYHTKSVDADYSYWSDDFIGDLVVNNSKYAYAAMEGTSMATPCVSGIIAQWLQACVEAGKTPSPDYIKEVMAATWDTDEWTNGTGSGAHGAKTFGTHGKINAIKGIQYILGVSVGPVITATPTTVDFEGYATETYTKTVNVKGISLEGNITATLSGGSGVYSIDKNSVTQSNGSAQADITITWTPATAGTTNATLTLKSTGADDVVVNITGVAQAATPTIMVDAPTLDFSTQLNEEQSKTVTVTGRFLAGDVTVSLNDPNGVFSVNTTKLTATSDENTLTPLIVTFNSADEGTFTGTVTLTGAGAEEVVISLSAEANDGGKATDAYLNIAKYATIDEAGWNTSYVNNLYKYTEYENNGYAWLTLPVYGAFVGARYATNSKTVGSGQPQKWIESSLGTNNTYAGKTWVYTASASNPFNGSSAYFTSTTARAIGYNYKSNTSIRSVSFYVTNTTEVKLYGTGANGVSSTYPARLRIYECTKNADGKVTASSTATVDQTNSTTSTFTLQSGTLDATKIYKVEASIYRGYLYEISFKTPLKSNMDNRSEQTLSYSEIPSKTYGDAAFTLPEKTAEGLTITWASSDVNIAAVSGNTLTIKGAGTATITATQEGDDNYKPFTKDFTLDIAKATLCITAKSFTITEGDELPVFDVEYEGFAYDEAASVLTTLPTVSCSATSTSAPGTYDITVSGAEAQNYEMTYVNGILTIEASKILMGDVNDDGDIDVMDVVTMVSYIMGRDPAGFIFAAADHTADGEVDVMDLVCQVSLVMSQAASSAPAVSSFDALGSRMTLDGASDGALYVGLGDGRQYVASQFVITLSDGQQLSSVTADRRHTVSIQSMGDNRYFVMSYSAANETFASSDHALTLRVAGSGMVTVDEGTFVSADGQKVVFESTSSTTTGIDSTTFDSNVPADVYSTGGMLIRKGTANTEELPAGVYIVNGKKYIRK